MTKNIEITLLETRDFASENHPTVERLQEADSRAHARRPRIYWKNWDDLIGNVSDADLARQIGCDRSTVTFRRNKIGIAPYPLVRRKAG